MKKILLLCGGRSPEHDVSLDSCCNIIKNIDVSKYDIYIAYINKEGKWFLLSLEPLKAKEIEKTSTQDIKRASYSIHFICKAGIIVEDTNSFIHIDLVFPVLHGPYGEDGTIQGFLETINIPYVGCGPLSSAICMNKSICKKIASSYGIRIPKFLSISREKKIDYLQLKEMLGSLLVIKPENLGSSIGVNIVENQKDFEKYWEEAIQYSEYIIIEEYIKGKEIECGVLEDRGQIITSIPGEIRTTYKFYSYEAKYYSSEKETLLIIPAEISNNISIKIQQLAKKIFEIFRGKDFARIDFIVAGENIYFNEVNTIPGFTSRSMYPRMFEKCGIATKKLISILINNNLK